MSTVIALEGVHRRFGKVKALDGLNLSVRQGEVYGLLGRNGAGKTTTMRIMMGILAADAGAVRVLDHVGMRLPVKVKERIGYVSQEQNFYAWMSAEQLGRFVAGFYPTWDEQEFKRLLAVLDVDPKRRASELSGGTRTKLGLALALAPRPPLLMLDEPTAGLDPVARHEFNELVTAMVRQHGTTAFFSSHLVDEVQKLAHRVGIVQAGRARFEGDVGELRATVRRVVRPAIEAEPPPFPEGLSVLRGDIVQGAPSAWDAAAWTEGTRVEQLSLEEIFLAFAQTSTTA
ncbi:MAG: ABC transporter ATP-binding protein [Archangium sp.]|nr:ABC transporter ATP-binding protein [Archangium sp.]